jgi:hypothetical protein
MVFPIFNLALWTNRLRRYGTRGCQAHDACHREWRKQQRGDIRLKKIEEHHVRKSAKEELETFDILLQ